MRERESVSYILLFSIYIKYTQSWFVIMIDMQDDRRIPMHPQIFGIGIDTIRHS